jgi:CBS domain-containing protein
MQVKDILSILKTVPITIDGGKSVYEAMKLLVDNRIGSVIVINADNAPIGIITERDIFRLAYRTKGNMFDAKIRDHMTPKLIVGVPEDDIDYIAQVITQNRIRHIPIVDQKGKLTGIVSIGDIVKAKLSQAEVHVRYLTEYIIGRSEPTGRR